MLLFLGLNFGDHAAPPLPDIPELNIECGQDLQDVPRNVKRHCAHSSRMLRESSHSQDIANAPLLYGSFCCSEKLRRPQPMPASSQQQATTKTLPRYSLAGFLLTDDAKPYCHRPASAPVYLFGRATPGIFGGAISNLDPMVPQTTLRTSSQTDDDISAQPLADFILTDDAKPYCDRPASAPVYLFGRARPGTSGRAIPHTTPSSTAGPTEDHILQPSLQRLTTKTIARTAIGLRARPCPLHLNTMVSLPSLHYHDFCQRRQSRAAQSA